MAELRLPKPIAWVRFPSPAPLKPPAGTLFSWTRPRIRALPANRIAEIRDWDLERECERLYSARLPYHNFHHVQTVLGAAERLLDDCAKEGLEVDGQIVYYALLLHDAGYHESHLALGYASKEAYSAVLARRLLSARAVPDAIISRVEQAILATLRDGQCRGPEDAVVRMADLSGIGADYAEFLRNTVNIRAEVALMTNTPLMPWAEWCAGTQKVLSGYLSGEVGLTADFDRARPGNFFERGQANLERLALEPEPA